MNLFEGKTPAERRKLIAAITLGALALVSLSYMLFGSGAAKPATNSNRRTSAQTTSSSPASRAQSVPAPSEVRETQVMPVPIVFPDAPPAVPEARRNIFAYYIAPVSPSPSVVAALTPPPAPALPPPLILASISPSNVYARTGDFNIEVAGDKFTSPVRIFIDNTEIPTRFISPQQVSANVPGALITSEGAHLVSVKTSDGSLFSNTATLNVMAPPTPNYSFIGILGGRRYNDTAILKDKNTKEQFNVTRGDVVGGRFRVTSISEREVALIDTSLHIKHTLPYSGESSDPNNRAAQQQRYQPPKISDDDDTEP